MCKQRDIILIDSYQSHGCLLSQHSFVVIDDQGGQIRSVPYDLMCLVLSSFKDPTQKARKLRYPGNLPVPVTDVSVPGGNSKEGYIKADQFYYFQKDNINYTVIGSMTEEMFDKLVDSIEESDFEIEEITDNLQPTMV